MNSRHDHQITGGNCKQEILTAILSKQFDENFKLSIVLLLRLAEIDVAVMGLYATIEIKFGHLCEFTFVVNGQKYFSKENANCCRVKDWNQMKMLPN